MKSETEELARLADDVKTQYQRLRGFVKTLELQPEPQRSDLSLVVDVAQYVKDGMRRIAEIQNNMETCLICGKKREDHGMCNMNCPTKDGSRKVWAETTFTRSHQNRERRMR